MSNYQALVRRLYQVDVSARRARAPPAERRVPPQINLFHPAKLGLETMQALHARLGSPLENELRRKVVHIAGTNGKGSVAWKVARTLQSAGLRTGLFVSPHVSSFRERAQVNGELISEARVAALLAEIFAAMDAGPEPVRATFFEITTALALRHFAESGVDALVLEAGLGGRLDATNIVAAPALSVITSIALEHTRVPGRGAHDLGRAGACGARAACAHPSTCHQRGRHPGGA